MSPEINSIRARLHWKNRKSYTLTIPPAFLQGNFICFPRTNQLCKLRTVESESGRPTLMIEFE